MKNILYVFACLYLISCGSSAPVAKPETESVSKTESVTAKKAIPDVDWSSTRSKVEISNEPKIYGLEDSPDLVNPPEVKDEIKTVVDNSLTKEKKGYRIQIYVTNSKKIADEVAFEAKNTYRYKVYVSFNAPNYTIKIGNYTTADQAKLDLDQVLDIYRNATVVPDFISSK